MKFAVVFNEIYQLFGENVKTSKLLHISPLARSGCPQAQMDTTREGWGLSWVCLREGV